MRTIRVSSALTILLVGLSSCMNGDVPVENTDQSDFTAFEDPDSDFSTVDVLDVDGEIVRFNAATQQMTWVADSLTFDGFDVDGNLLSRGFFTVRFGTDNGVRKAYFTETDPPTICDVSAPGGILRISSTDVTVPQE